MVDIKIYALDPSDPAWKIGARWAVVKPCWHPCKRCAVAVTGMKTDTLENALSLVPRVEMMIDCDLQVHTTDRLFTPEAARKELVAWDDPHGRARARKGQADRPYFNERQEDANDRDPT